MKSNFISIKQINLFFFFSIYDFEPADHENYVQACDLNYEK